MRNATRNRILTVSTFALYTALAVGLAWVMLAAHLGSRVWVLIAALGFACVWGLYSSIRVGAMSRQTERVLRDGGAEIPDEEPIPIGLAINRESLIVSIIALALIGLVFIAYYSGWLRKFVYL